MRIIILLLISVTTFAQLPSSGSLSLKSAAGAGRSISQEVDGNETGNKSLTTLSLTVGFTAPHSILEFYGYPPAPAVPGTPSNCVATSNDPNGIDLSWDHPASGGTPTYTRISVSVNGGASTFLVDVTYPTNTYNHAHADLTTGNSYVYNFQSYNASGAGAASCTAASVTYNPTSAPGVPTNLVVQKALPSGSAGIEVGWDPPASGGTPTNYRVEVSEDGGPYAFLVDSGISTTITHAHADLTAGLSYQYRVRAENAIGNSTYATSSSITY